MSKPTMEDGLYAPKESERDNGTDFRYEKLAWDGCPVCEGFGEFHVPYTDYDTYIIHRCDCSRPKGSQAVVEAVAPKDMCTDKAILEILASGGAFEKVDPVGTNYEQARRQAEGILKMWNVNLDLVLIKMITKIQQQEKSIEMFEYTQKWRKRRP